MTAVNYALVALGGLVGCMLRYGLGGWVQSLVGSTFPYGTLAINVLGALVIGFLMELSLGRGLIGAQPRLLLTTGFCGGFTTFSTFSYEALGLLQDQQWLRAGAYILLSVGLCLAAVFGGVVLARVL